MRSIKEIYSGKAKQLPRGQNRGCHPIAHGADRSTVQAPRLTELGRAVRTHGVVLKHIECLSALSARPVLADRWGLLTSRADKAVSSWELGDSQQRTRMLQ